MPCPIKTNTWSLERIGRLKTFKLSAVRCVAVVARDEEVFMFVIPLIPIGMQLSVLKMTKDAWKLRIMLRHL